MGYLSTSLGEQLDIELSTSIKVVLEVPVVLTAGKTINTIEELVFLLKDRNKQTNCTSILTLSILDFLFHFGNTSYA